jgi:hypothetical protein
MFFIDTDTDAIIFNTGLFDGDCNCHGPDESLDIAAVKKFTSVFAYTVHSMLAADKDTGEMMEEKPEDEEGEATASIVVSNTEETPMNVVSKFTINESNSSSKSNMLTGNSLVFVSIASWLFLFGL